MHDKLFDVGPGGFQILAGIKISGMLSHVLPDGAGHGKTQVRVDVDLADGHGCGLAELLFGNTHCIGHLTAVLIDHLHILLRNGRRTVEHNGESGQTPGDLLQNVKPQRRGNQNALLVPGALGGGELVCAVGGADGDSQRVAAGALYKLLHVLGTGVGGILCGNLDLILYTGQRAQLGLYHNAVVMGILHHLTGDGNILFKGLGGCVDHNGGKAVIDAGLAGFKGVAVIQMQADGKPRLNLCGLYQLNQIGAVGVGTGALGYLQDDRCVALSGSLGDALNDLHIVDVKGADGIAAVIGLFEHFGGCNNRHVHTLL